jgi:hypothetical protein
MRTLFGPLVCVGVEEGKRAMTTNTVTDTHNLVRLMTCKERPWRPADYPPCAIDVADIANRASVELRANGNTAAHSAYVDRLHMRAVAYELHLRSLSNELHRVRLAKAALEQEMTTAARRSGAQRDGRQTDRRGEGAL